MDLRLSIIVPVYNVEQWLLRCLESLFVQNLCESDFEVIVVNDGSTDNSLSVANDFAALHSNVKVVTRENGGLSAARNTGLKIAKGKYVWFIDSDDFAVPNSIKPLLERAENNNLDVQCFNLQLYYENGRIDKYVINSKYIDNILTGKEFVIKCHMPPAAWLAFYRRNFLLNNDLWFKEGIIHEDQEFTPRAYYLAKRISFSDKVVINYFQREGSIMKSYNPHKCRSLLVVCDSLYDFKCAHMKPGSLVYDVFDEKIAFAFSQALANYNRNIGISLKEFKTKPYYPLSSNLHMPRKSRYKVLLMNTSLRVYLILRNIFSE